MLAMALFMLMFGEKPTTVNHSKEVKAKQLV
jgi:hypothetical protein